MREETSCPRCGYDQEGILRSFEDSCPLESRCTECGLLYRWSELVTGRLHLPRWLVEHAPWSRLPVVLCAALPLAPIGFVLWRRLRLTNPIVSSRLLLLVLAAGVACWAVLAMPIAFEVSRRMEMHTTSRGPGWHRPEPALVLGMMTRAGLLPLSDHPLRYVVRSTSDPTVRQEALIPSPRRLWMDVTAPLTAAAQGLGFLAAVGSAITFTVISASRRGGRIEARHIHRYLAYLAAAQPALLLAMWLLAPQGPASLPRLLRDSPHLLLTHPGVIAISAGFLFAWWWAVARSYLRLQHAALTAACASAVGLALAALAAAAW